jgi:glycosyltransferase involved in cell wall biosynthesis
MNPKRTAADDSPILSTRITTKSEAEDAPGSPDRDASVRARQHLYLSSVMWDGLWIIQQPICNEIQKGEPVLFVERPVSLFTVIRYPHLWRRLLSWLRGARRVSPNLRVLAPLPLFHLGHRFPRLFNVELAIQRLWVLSWARAKGHPRRILWFDHPVFEAVVGRMGESISIYHVGDEPGEFRTSHRPIMNELEDRALKKATFVFAAADELAQARRARNSRTFAIQNAIDTSAFSEAVPAKEFADVDGIATPRVGFVGVIDSWIDVPLLETTAKALPHVSFVIVGPAAINVAGLRALPNVHLIGVRHRRLVPGILRRMSASLVPFVRNDLTRRIVPGKIMEALAAGVVPVCTAFSRNLDELERRKLVAVARSDSGFVELVRDAIQGDTVERRAELAAFGLRQTWADRWKEMSRILAESGEPDASTGGREMPTEL